MGSRPNSSSTYYGIVVVAAIVLVALCLMFGPWRASGIYTIVASPILQNTHAIGLAMYSYENDNNGKYPIGKSSTEVFQQLIDGGYVTNPDIFYLPMPGKFKAAAGDKLKPENVCWDVTAGLTANSPPSIPLLFTTGYKVTYAPDASAVPVIKPYPLYGISRTWTQWLTGAPSLETDNDPGISVYYVNNSARFISLSTSTTSGASIPDFVPPDFTPDGKTYVQLTPDGPLSN